MTRLMFSYFGVSSCLLMTRMVSIVVIVGLTSDRAAVASVGTCVRLKLKSRQFRNTGIIVTQRFIVVPAYDSRNGDLAVSSMGSSSSLLMLKAVFTVMLDCILCSTIWCVA